jgi:subtilisin-like proprotein convertase family protein
VHDSGTLWCSGLIDCLHRLGRPVMDAIVLDHHYALGTSATMADAANQVIQSDIDLFGGAHVGTLVDRFAFWGFVDPADFVPILLHTPLTDREDVTGPCPVLLTVSAAEPLEAASPELYWGFGAAITDSVVMTPTGNPQEYGANIPGPGAATNVVYYLRAANQSGGTAYKPATAPTSMYTFHLGPDVTPPVIVHTPLTQVTTTGWPAAVTATVTDNLGVDPASVTVTWTFDAVAQTPFTLARVGSTNTYTANFPARSVVAGDVVTYHLTAQDIASTPNTARYPFSGERSFTITGSLGTVLVLDDDELSKQSGTKAVADGKDPSHTVTLSSSGGATIQSANVLTTWLNAMGFVASVEPANSSDPTTWPGYAFIVSASGGNLLPIASATYRANLEAYVAAGHKLLIEGGEVGYKAIASPGYPSFAANVLHGNIWQTDNAGALQRVPGQSSHPLAITPNVLPATIPITFTGTNYGTEDAYSLLSPAYAVYGTNSYQTSAGISVYDNDVAPQSAQIVAFAFDIKDVTDSTIAKQVLENAAHFLVAPQPAPHSTLSGRLALGAAWAGGGVTVSLAPGGLTTTTASDGTFSFAGMYAGAYSVSASVPAFTGSPRHVTLAQDQMTSIVLRMYPEQYANGCNSPALAIPDNNSAGITNDMAIEPAFNIKSVEVYVNISHPWKGDLIVEIRHNSTNVRLHNRTGGSTHDIIGTYPTTITPAQSLTAFTNQTSTGTWTLFVSDNALSDVGTLNQWCLTLHGPSDTTQTLAADVALPTALEFARAWPNPAHGGSVSLGFALPAAAPVKLALYDVAGRKVRTVADRTFEAGRYQLVWDAHDDRGAVLRPGLYLARLTAGERTLTRRLVVAP